MAQRLPGYGTRMSAAHELDPTKAQQHIGTVLREAEKFLWIRTLGGDVGCRRAASCLLAPEPGDTVLVAVADSGRAWVLAVLERADTSQARLEVEGDVTLKTGSFTVAGREVGVLAGRFALNALDGEVALQRLSYVGRFVQSEVERIKSVAASFDGIFERFSQRVKRSYRTVEELEQLQARQLDYKVDKTMSMRGGTAIVAADKLVKVDGEQIHLG